jgi:hypothetical protein
MVRLAVVHKRFVSIHRSAMSPAVHLQRCCSLTAAGPGVLFSAYRQLTIRAVCRIQLFAKCDTQFGPGRRNILAQPSNEVRSGLCSAASG